MVSSLFSTSIYRSGNSYYANVSFCQREVASDVAASSSSSRSQFINEDHLYNVIDVGTTSLIEEF